MVNLRNEPDGTVTLRYLADAPQLPGSISAQPRLEDLYLWLFPEKWIKQNEPVSFGIETCKTCMTAILLIIATGAGSCCGISVGDLYRLDGTGCQRENEVSLHGSESNPKRQEQRCPVPSRRMSCEALKPISGCTGSRRKFHQRHPGRVYFIKNSARYQPSVNNAKEAFADPKTGTAPGVTGLTAEDMQNFFTASSQTAEIGDWLNKAKARL